MQTRPCQPPYTPVTRMKNAAIKGPKKSPGVYTCVCVCRAALQSRALYHRRKDKTRSKRVPNCHFEQPPRICGGVCCGLGMFRDEDACTEGRADKWQNSKKMSRKIRSTEKGGCGTGSRPLYRAGTSGLGGRFHASP
jgi:hypothetical protein